MNGRAGAGVLSEELELSCSIRLGELVSVYQAEILGLIYALNHLVYGKVQERKVQIALDNHSVIKSMCMTGISSKLVQECVQKLNICATLNEVTLLREMRLQINL